jgi:peptidoglycan/xylan/chitin deacetylase (PgdA/CDA1 family)
LLLLPPLLVATGRSDFVTGELPAVFGLGCLAFICASLARPGGWLAALTATLGVLLVLALAPDAANPWLRSALALLDGFALGVLAPPTRGAATPFAAGAAIAAATALLVAALAATPALWAVVGAILLSLLPSAARASRLPRRLAGLLALAALPVLGSFSMLAVGAFSPTSSWFGTLISHGPRSASDVALTFDDGPNGDTTLATAAILESHHAQGTFFVVGRAVRAQPDVVRALVSRGHLVANHSQTHGLWAFLAPGYPEFNEAESAILDATGLCAGFYRPPRGAHTPLLAREVERHGARVVTWDVGVADWNAKDPAELASRVVDAARGGSVIVLHDGFEGRPGVDRQVLLDALPTILDRLTRKGLRPVRLDVLLNRPGYIDSCAD